MCVLVSAAGTPTKAPAKVFAFATEPPLNLPPDRASLRMLLGARRRRTLCVCSSLTPALRRSLIVNRCCSETPFPVRESVHHWLFFSTHPPFLSGEGSWSQ